MYFEALERSKSRSRLKRAFETAKDVDVLATETRALLTHHLCVLSAGVLEECIRLHISEFARAKSHGYIAEFVANSIAKATNFNSEKLVDLLRQMDNSLACEMSDFIDDRRKAGLNSLIALRHKIAHGKDAGTSLHTVMNYNDIVLEILDKADEMFGRVLA